MHVNEKELLRLIKKDQQAFGIIYDWYYNSIFSYAFRRLANYELARDITAETFLEAFQKINSFTWRNVPISAWLFRIASNEMNLYFRRSKYTSSLLSSENFLQQLVYEAGVEREKEALEQALKCHTEFANIQKQLLKLENKYQEVIALRFFEEKSIKEIAVILNKKEGTIKSLLSRGLGKLRVAMEK